MKKRICVLGDGAFGTAFAQFIASNGYEVNLWCYNSTVYDEIIKTRTNNIYLPNIKLDSKIFATTDIKSALNNTDIIFEAIPAQFLHSSLRDIADSLGNKIICVLTKGLANSTTGSSFDLPTQVIEKINSKAKLVVISGPSFAVDLALLNPTGLVLASKDKSATTSISEILNNKFDNKLSDQNFTRPRSPRVVFEGEAEKNVSSGGGLNIYLEFTEDIIGVQVAGAVKNVIALGVGILDGCGYSDNTKALFFYKSINEIKTLIKYFGGNPESVYLLSGIGDLVLTAFMSQGRNKQVGFNIGRGEKICDILKEVNFVPEGANTIKSINEILEKNNLDLPICKAIYNIVYNNFKVETLISKLF